MKKKILSAVLCVVMTASMLAGCGGTETGGENAGSDAEQGEADGDTGESTGESSADAAENEEDITITVWSIATESDAFHPAYLKAIEDYENAHPGIKIKLETFENESYKTKIKSAVAANELPDVFFTWAGGFSKSFVDSGKVLELDEYYESYKEDLSETVLENVTYDGKLYGSVISTPISVMFYNKAMFEKYELEAPQTWEEWKNVCQTFLDNGITPIGISAKDTWVLAMTHDAMTLKSAGPEMLTKALKKEGQSYNDAAFLDSASKLKELIDMGAFSEGATGLSNDEASADFYAGKVAMYTTGSWMAGSIQTDAENPEDFGVTPIPVLNSDNAKITDFMGGASDTLMASAASEHPDIAAEVVFELTKGISHYSYLDGAGIPAWKIDYDDSSVNALTKEVADYAAGATSFTLWFDTLLESEDAGEYLALLQELYVGNMTPEDFVEAMADQLE